MMMLLMTLNGGSIFEKSSPYLYPKLNILKLKDLFQVENTKLIYNFIQTTISTSFFPTTLKLAMFQNAQPEQNLITQICYTPQFSTKKFQRIESIKVSGNGMKFYLKSDHTIKSLYITIKKNLY